MHAFRSVINCAAFGVLLSALSTGSQASVPDIALAPSHVEGYIQCIKAAYASERWRSKTVAECRASNPAVQSLQQGDYVALTFTTAQSNDYNQSRKRWVDFDKTVKQLIYSKGLAQLFGAVGVQTAYSFKQVSTDLDTRFSELEAPPFSWYPGKKPPYLTASGLTLEQLHAAELDRFSRCLGASISKLDVLTSTRQTVDVKAGACIRDITKLNSDATQGLYNVGDFSQVTNQYWAQIASTQAQAREAERVRLEQEKANSWPVRLKALAGQAMVFLLIIAGLFAAYRYFKDFFSVGHAEGVEGQYISQAHYRTRRTEPDDADDEPRREAPRSAPTPRRPDLGTFTLQHKKVCSLTTKHMCSSCSWWAGERTPHPVTSELYVKVGTVGKCSHRHPGSPYGMKRYDAGMTCKDFQDLGV
ncbi:hypothetical protein [Pseudomonas alkylphenolica]|uniref:hypothetical protein n=1 Tax=Pseudomonas alkylphenolica TaxID=237609 RepID=UPI0018D93620|nr:hypothetical protein [Pseudomonas alkylphenolica]MBH3430215.1 hypothetical protein [Pseudomonas alkylphenolica]